MRGLSSGNPSSSQISFARSMNSFRGKDTGGYGHGRVASIKRAELDCMRLTWVGTPGGYAEGSSPGDFPCTTATSFSGLTLKQIAQLIIAGSQMSISSSTAMQIFA